MEAIFYSNFYIKYFNWFILFNVILNLHSCRPKEDRRLYIQEINTQRAKKDAFFKYSDNSPLNQEAKKVFSGLNYFKIDPEYKIIARVERIEEPVMVYLKNSMGEEMRVFPNVRLWFELENREMSLLAFSHFDVWMHYRETGFVFIPFSDKSNEELTYPMGRYIDVELKNSDVDEVVIDFNKAYNPFCAFDPNIVCPYPPAENFLSISIPAGEKRWN